MQWQGFLQSLHQLVDWLINFDAFVGYSRPLKTVNVDCATATARLVYDGQARRAVLVEFLARFRNWLIRATTCSCGTHDLFDANFGSTAVISSYAATHVALGYDADQLEVFYILNHRGAATT